MLTVQSEIQPLLINLWADFDYIFRTTLQRYIEQLITFLGVIWIKMLTFKIGNLGHMGIMSCLSLGGLRSLSALVIKYNVR